MSGKVAIVTGGAKGIGYAIAEALLARGHSVVIADRAGAKEAAATLGGGAIGVAADVTSEAQVAAMVEAATARFGRLDALVNNAGWYSAMTPKGFEALTVEDWRRVLEINVIGLFLCCRAAAPALRAAGGGAIVNISSGVAFKGNPDMLHYVASKGAVVSMTRSLATELGGDRIRVNSVAPGLTLSQGLLENPVLSAGVTDWSIRSRALKREMFPADLGGAVAFLVSDDSAFITGQTLVVDGGAYYH